MMKLCELDSGKLARLKVDVRKHLKLTLTSYKLSIYLRLVIGIIFFIYFNIIRSNKEKM